MPRKSYKLEEIVAKLRRGIPEHIRSDNGAEFLAKVVQDWIGAVVLPYASIGYRGPAPEVFVPAFAAWPAAQPRPAPPAMLPLVPRPALN